MPLRIPRGIRRERQRWPKHYYQIRGENALSQRSRGQVDICTYSLRSGARLSNLCQRRHVTPQIGRTSCDSGRQLNGLGRRLPVPANGHTQFGLTVGTTGATSLRNRSNAEFVYIRNTGPAERNYEEAQGLRAYRVNLILLFTLLSFPHLGVRVLSRRRLFRKLTTAGRIEWSYRKRGWHPSSKQFAAGFACIGTPFLLISCCRLVVCLSDRPRDGDERSERVEWVSFSF